MKMNSKGQAIYPILSIVFAFLFIGALLVVIANQPIIGAGEGVISRWCTDTIGNVVPAASPLCASLPFEAIGTISNPPPAPSAVPSGLTPQYQVTTILFRINPVEKYLAGTGTSTITCERQVGGAWLSDLNSNSNETLAVSQSMNLLCGDDGGSGTDYYKRWFPNVNTGIVSPYNPTYLFTREGTLTHTITNSNGITENATSATADINASQTYYFNIKTDNTTSYSCYGNEYTQNKVAVTIDANYNGEISKVTPFGITATGGAVVPPSHSTDTNATTTIAFNVPTLNLCNGAGTTWKLKVEGLSTMPTNLHAAERGMERLKVCFYDYSFVKNTDSGAVVESTYNPVTNADIGVTSSQCEYIYFN